MLVVVMRSDRSLACVECPNTEWMKLLLYTEASSGVWVPLCDLAQFEKGERRARLAWPNKEMEDNVIALAGMIASAKEIDPQQADILQSALVALITLGLGQAVGMRIADKKLIDWELFDSPADAIEKTLIEIMLKIANDR